MKGKSGRFFGENSSGRDPVRLGEVVSGVMKKLGLGNERWLVDLSGEWEEIAGQAVAKHTRPGRINGGRLVIFVDNSVWLSELNRGGVSKMLENLQNRFGADKIKSVRLELDPGDPSD